MTTVRITKIACKWWEKDKICNVNNIRQCNRILANCQDIYILITLLCGLKWFAMAFMDPASANTIDKIAT